VEDWALESLPLLWELWSSHLTFLRFNIFICKTTVVRVFTVLALRVKFMGVCKASKAILGATKKRKLLVLISFFAYGMLYRTVTAKNVCLLFKGLR